VSEALPIKRDPFGSVSLFWPVFLTNALLLTAGATILALSPATVSFPVTARQAVVLLCGVVCLVVANAVVVHIVVRPLQRFAALMGRVDLLQPGQRITPEGSSELRALADSFNEMLVRLEAERRASSSRALGSQEEERRLVARELHDEVGQGLTALLLRLRAVVRIAPPELQPQLHEVQALAREKLETVRRVARDLRPSVLDDLGLGYALHALVDVVEGDGRLQCVRRIDVDVERPSPDVELALYRIAQEALTNVVRHADATCVVVDLHETDNRRLVLSVEDDGRGLPEGAQLTDGGMQGMRERALASGAALHVRSAASGGTRVSVSVARAAR
jgi:two-component system, NarL family, sensor histidine kinase UhpB